MVGASFTQLEIEKNLQPPSSAESKAKMQRAYLRCDFLSDYSFIGVQCQNQIVKLESL